VNGYSDGTFRPDQNITREEAMAIIQRAMKLTKLSGKDPDRYKTFTDFDDVSDWAASSVKEVLAPHVFNGTKRNDFSAEIQSELCGSCTGRQKPVDGIKTDKQVKINK